MEDLRGTPKEGIYMQSFNISKATDEPAFIALIKMFHHDLLPKPYIDCEIYWRHDVAWSMLLYVYNVNGGFNLVPPLDHNIHTCKEESRSLLMADTHFSKPKEHRYTCIVHIFRNVKLEMWFQSTVFYTSSCESKNPLIVGYIDQGDYAYTTKPWMIRCLIIGFSLSIANAVFVQSIHDAGISMLHKKRTGI